MVFSRIKIIGEMKMIDVTKDQTVEVQDSELIELFIEEGQVILMLACEIETAGEVYHLEVRAMNNEQVDALIEALQNQKELLG
jgi:hypothetical protein